MRRGVKHLIVNGDDFGASHGINRGILEAHRDGILTSASLFVDRPWSSEAVALAREAPDLSVGLHADLDGLVPNAVRAELLRQLTRFGELLGSPPTHLDSHHNVHRSSIVLPDFMAVAEAHDLAVRDFSKVRYVSAFYGQRSGRTDLQRIGVVSLVHLLRTSVQDGLTELGCHPGYVDADLVSRYTTERECELRTLCDASVREAIREAGIVLVGFRDVPRILGESATPVE
jgi:chitin disaccharide deacetylase